jgi:Tol biopolymer transport system component
MPSRIASGTAAIAVLLLLIAPACGGGGGAEPTPTPAAVASPTPASEFPAHFRRATPDPHGATVTGRVVFGFGERGPVADHIVQIDCGADSDGETLWCLSWTQPDGSFSVSGVPQGRHWGGISHIVFTVDIARAGETVDLGTLEYPLVHPPIFELAYIDDAGDMWGVYGDYSEKMNLTQDSPVRCLRPRGLYWSRNGAWLACMGSGTSPQEQTTLVIVDAAGNPRLAMEPKAHLESFSWSPAGRDYAYVLVLPDGSRTVYVQPVGPVWAGDHPAATLEGVREVFWSPDGSQLAYSRGPADTLTVYDLASQKESTIRDGLRPLAWVLGGKVLLTASDNFEVPGLYATYGANLLDLATHELKPVPQLDNDAQFWPSPDGQTVAFFTHEAGAAISLLDLATGAVSPIPSAVPHLREWIPPDHMAFSPDGSQLFWADLPIPAEEPHPSVIYRADVDGGGMTKIGEIESVEIRFSPDRTKVLYNGAGTGDDRALWVANIDGSEARRVAESAWPAAWRPLAPLK